MNILYEDNSIIVINKPAGIASQSANIAQQDCVSQIKNHLKQNNEVKGEPYVGVIHRLDQPVSGILVFAKNKHAAANLSKQIQEDIMNKKYYALVEGKVADSEEKILLKNQIYKDTKASKAVVVNSKGKAEQKIKVQEASLFYKVKKYYEKEDVTLLDIELITGRFHQIRCQLSNMGNPIVNDKKYGAKRAFLSDFSGEEMIAAKGIGLRAYELEFKHPENGKTMIFSLDLQND